MIDRNYSNPGTEPVATESELSVAQMVQVNAVYRLAALKRRLEARHPGELDAENMDPDHVARLTRVVQADKDECELLSATMRRIRLLNEMIDELEDLALKLKAKAWADGDSRTHDFVQETKNRSEKCRGVIENVAEQIIKQREEIMDGR